MRNFLRPVSWADIEADQRYEEIRRFSKQFEPKKGIAYHWVYDYAILTYEQATNAVRALDNKAEIMIKYVAPGTGILGLAIAWFMQSISVNFWSSVSIGIGIVFLVSSMVSSFLSLLPHQQALPPGTKDATDCTDFELYDSEQALGLFATGIDASVVVKVIVADVKSKYLRYSQAFFIISLLFIFGGLFWAIITNV